MATVTLMLGSWLSVGILLQYGALIPPFMAEAASSNRPEFPAADPLDAGGLATRMPW